MSAWSGKYCKQSRTLTRTRYEKLCAAGQQSAMIKQTVRLKEIQKQRELEEAAGWPSIAEQQAYWVRKSECLDGVGVNRDDELAGSAKGQAAQAPTPFKHEPPDCPTLQEQREYWERKEQLQRDYMPNDEFVGGENDHYFEEQQYSNYSEEQL